MPTTYTPLATTTTAGGESTVTFSGISGAYTDLIIVADVIVSGTNNSLSLRFNSDTGNNYSLTYLYGNGTTPASGRLSNNNFAYLGYFTTPGTQRGYNAIGHIQNYSNTNTFKTIITRSNSVPGNTTYPGAETIVNLWRSTSAITSVTIGIGGFTFSAGSTFSLYGIASAAVVSGAKATGGDIVTTDGSYWYHAFRASGTFTPTQALTADVLVVAGGGGGGGGAGGLLAFSSQSLSATNHTVTIGGGGGIATSGSNSVFGALTTVIGGGAGAPYPNNNGVNGGSAGGGTGTGIGGTATSGQGNNGGNGFPTGSGTTRANGGGGGAGAVGGNATSGQGGTGGNGTNAYSSWLSITGLGVNGYIAGGGGGGSGTNNASGGLGGGGTGTQAPVSSINNGIANTGGGAGGGYTSGAGTGGSGLVIVRYAV